MGFIINPYSGSSLGSLTFFQQFELAYYADLSLTGKYSVRVLIPSGLFLSGGKGVKVAIEGGSTNGVIIDHVSIGEWDSGSTKGGTVDTPTMLTFSGSASTTVPATSYNLSDAVAFSINPAKSYVVIVDVSASNTNWDMQQAYPVTGAQYFYKAGVASYDDPTPDNDFITGTADVLNCVSIIQVGADIDDYTKLLVHGDGYDATTNIYDYTKAPHSITVQGNTQTDTAYSKFGGGSVKFDGSGDYLQLADSADWDFGNGDFTIDFWMRPGIDVGGTQTGLLDQFYTSRAWATSYTASRLYFNWSTDGSSVSGTYLNASITNDVWYHVAYVRNGADLKIYLDGTSLGTINIGTDTIYNSTVPLYIGAYHTGDTSAGGFFTGHMDEIRISKGIARWTSNFTPPTAEYGTL